MTASHFDASKRSAVLVAAAIAAAKALGISEPSLCCILGAHEDALARWRDGDGSIEDAPRVFHRATLLIQVWRALDAIVGGDQSAARRWISAPNMALDACPVDMMVSDHGLCELAAYLIGRRDRS